MNQWTDILDREQLEACYALTANLDPAFAVRARQFWESRTRKQLEVLRHGAWLCNDADQYQTARSYLELAP